MRHGCGHRQGCQGFEWGDCNASHSFTLDGQSMIRVMNMIKVHLVPIPLVEGGFLWGAMGVGYKLHLAKWSKVCWPMAVDGLGVRYFILLN